MERRPVGYNPEFLKSYKPGKTWYLSRSTRQHLHGVGDTPGAERPVGTYAREVVGRLMIDLAWASSRLEGNTYTRLDTQNLLEFGQRAEGKDFVETQMIINHKAAIALIVDEAELIGFNLFTFQNLHAALSENLLGEADDEGRLRTRTVEISGTVYHPLGIGQQIEEYFRLFLALTDEIRDPFEQAFFIMVHLPYLQPFSDVNKRTSRVAANIPFIKANLCPLSFVDVPDLAYVEGTLGVYELNRIELLRDVFVWAYERSSARYQIVRDSVNEPDPMRLRYRRELSDAVRDTIRSGSPPKLSRLREWAVNSGVRAEDANYFGEIALQLLLNLHDGALYRYGVTPNEFHEWRDRYS